jgi:hypothetical protein
MQMSRKKTEYNVYELVVACVLKKRTVQPHEFSSIPIQYNKLSDKDFYLQDLSRRSLKQVNTYIQRFTKELEQYSDLSVENIKEVFVTGKHCEIPEILQLNKNEDRLEAKADVYALLMDGSWIGISVKQDGRATKSNYSVQSLFGHVENIRLTNIKKQYLESNGFTSFQKSERSQVNKLFYQDNPYWDEIKQYIKQYNRYIATFLYDKLFASSLHYPLYEFDSKKMVLLTKEMSVITFEEHLPYYYDKNGKRRNAAKLFYKLCINDKEYRVEIRWKGNVFHASPQFQIHEE